MHRLSCPSLHHANVILRGEDRHLNSVRFRSDNRWASNGKINNNSNLSAVDWWTWTKIVENPSHTFSKTSHLDNLKFLPSRGPQFTLSFVYKKKGKFLFHTDLHTQPEFSICYYHPWHRQTETFHSFLLDKSLSTKSLYQWPAANTTNCPFDHRPFPTSCDTCCKNVFPTMTFSKRARVWCEESICFIVFSKWKSYLLAKCLPEQLADSSLAAAEQQRERGLHRIFRSSGFNFTAKIRAPLLPVNTKTAVIIHYPHWLP